MRKIQFVLTTLIVFVLVALLTGTASAAAPKSKWTVMVYMSGDNNLEPYIVSDIETELAPTGSTADVQVVALADRAPGYDTSRGDWQTTLLFHVTKGMLADVASAVPDANWQRERDMGDPQTLIDFVNWSKTNYPADHYALIFWGHGWNWRPNWVMKDDTTALTNPNNYALDYPDEKAAIPSLGFIDVVGYDGCNMASIEIFNLWHGHATAVTSSQEYVGLEGLQYDLVLAQMAATPSMTADQVATAFTQSTTTDKTWSAIAVDGRFDTLLTAANTWSNALKSGLGKYRKKYDQAFTGAKSFWQDPMDKDLYDMAVQINSKVKDTTINSSGQALMNAINSVVISERHVTSYASVHGITIYEPSKKSDVDYNYYQTNVDFALQTAQSGWFSFLNLYAK